MRKWEEIPADGSVHTNQGILGKKQTKKGKQYNTVGDQDGNSWEFARNKIRGGMPIQSEGARAHSDFWAKWILHAVFKRQKIADLYFLYLFRQSHRRDYIVQRVKSSADKFKSCWTSSDQYERDNTKFNTPAPHSHLRPCNTNESHDTVERKWLIGPNLDNLT